MNFSEYVEGKIGKKWVLARRTNYIIERYGEDVICLSKKQYKELQEEWDWCYGKRIISSAEYNKYQALKAINIELLTACKDAREVIALYIKRMKESGYDTKGGMMESNLAQLKNAIKKAEGKPCRK